MCVCGVFEKEEGEVQKNKDFSGRSTYDFVRRLARHLEQLLKRIYMDKYTSVTQSQFNLNC